MTGTLDVTLTWGDALIVAAIVILIVFIVRVAGR